MTLITYFGLEYKIKIFKIIINKMKCESYKTIILCRTGPIIQSYI